MTALVATVFLASLLGSLHCAGMCGAFVAFAVSAGDQQRQRPALRHIAYNGGRLVTYTLLGAAGGLLGSAVDLAGSHAGLQRSAAFVASAMMVGFGVVILLRERGVHVRRLPLPGALQSIVARGSRFAATKPPVVRALLIGLLTTLLPCGWLYAFAITAAGTGSPATGALTMAVFWMGTLPILVTIGAGARQLTGRFGARAPVITAAALIAVGLATIVLRFEMPMPMRMSDSDLSMRSGAQAEPTTPADTLNHVDHAAPAH